MSLREKRGPLALEAWARNHVDGYKRCNIKNMTTSWRNGLAFCALIHRFRPDLIDYDELDPEDIVGNCSLAFEIAERQLGIPALLDPSDMASMEVPDRLSVLTYVAQFYNVFKNMEVRSKPVKGSSSPENSSPKSLRKVEANGALDKKPRSSKRTLDIEDEALNEARKRLSISSSSQAPVMLRNSTSCSVCKNPVFISERILFNKKLYHRSCFRCFNCDLILNPQTADVSSDGLLFCIENTCFIESQKRSLESKLHRLTSNHNSKEVSLNGQSNSATDKDNVNSTSTKPEESKRTKNETSDKEKDSTVDPIRSDLVNGQVSQGPVTVTEEASEVHVHFDDKVVVKPPSTQDIDKEQTIAELSGEGSSSKEEEKTLDTETNLELQLEPSENITEPEKQPSDILVLKPNSSLASQLKQSEEEEVVRRNTVANAQITNPHEANGSRRNSAADEGVKPSNEMPNIYSESSLPIAQRIERNASKVVDAGKEKEGFLNGMLKEVELKEREDSKVTEGESNVQVKVERRSPTPSEGSAVISVLTEASCDKAKIQPSLPTPAKRRSSHSPAPSPTPRRKSPVPSTASTTGSTVSLSETTSPANTAPSPVPRRSKSKSKPPRPVPPSQASLMSLTNRGSVPSAKELWKKDNYYPAELNPFESEEDVSITPTKSVPGNPFEDDDDAEEEEQKPPSPKPTPKVRSARNQVNSINRSRSHSRSRSRSPVREPQPKPRTIHSAVTVPIKPEPDPKPYNPFEDDDGEENGVGDAEDPGTFLRQKEDRATENSATSSLSTTPLPQARHSLSPSVTSSPGGTVKKSSKNRRAPLPPTFTPSNAARPTNPVTPPSPKSILKNPSNSGSPSSQKKVIPASPDLLKGLKGCRPKKKRRAPPPRRRVEPLPEEAIKVELNDLIVKERELERQGIALESSIRNLMEQAETASTGSNGNNTEARTLETENEFNENGATDVNQQLDELMVQLFNVVNEKNEILRRQTELEYLRRSHRLEEMQAELEFKLRILMDTPVDERKENHAQVEQTLLDEMLKLVDERNDVVEWLDYHRKQDREEDTLLVSQTLTAYSNNSSLQRQSKQNSPVPLVKPAEGDKFRFTLKKKDKDKKSKDKEKGCDKNPKEEKDKDKKHKLKVSLFGKKKSKRNSKEDGGEEVNTVVNGGSLKNKNKEPLPFAPSNAKK